MTYRDTLMGVLGNRILEEERNTVRNTVSSNLRRLPVSFLGFFFLINMHKKAYF